MRKEITQKLLLDSRKPYLADHQVGQPLFGTCMGIGAMAGAAACLCAERIYSVHDIIGNTDCFVPDIFREVTVHAIFDSAAAAAQCRLYDNLDSFFHAEFYFKDAPIRKPDNGKRPAASLKAAQPEDIYNLFFHKNAFRVVNSCWVHEEVIISTLHTPLSPLGFDMNEMPLEPRLIEFCLQTAGLWTAIFKEDMQVPVITKNVYFLMDHPPADYENIWCRSRETPDGMESIAYKGTEPILLLTGYHTKSLPFPAPAEKILAFKRELI